MSASNEPGVPPVPPSDEPPSAAAAESTPEQTSARTDEGAPESSGPRSPWGARAVFAARAFIGTTLLAAIAVLVIQARARQQREPRHVVDLSEWRVFSRPAWSRLADLETTRLESDLVGRGASVFAAGDLALVEQAILRTPRVRRVIAIRRRLPSAIEVDVEYRRPVAAIWIGGESGGFVEVDDEGVALCDALSGRPLRDGRPLPVVTGIRGEAPAAGALFGDDVLSALGLAARLHQRADEEAAAGRTALRDTLALLDEIDVSNHRGRANPAAAHVLLRAAAPSATAARATECVVEWGRADEERGESSLAHKADLLVAAATAFDGLLDLERARVWFRDLRIVPAAGSALDDARWSRSPQRPR